MGRRLYVGNLPYDVDEAALREVFAQDGRQVERVYIPLDRETQRPRGFAFVEFATENDAQEALAALDGELLSARPMRISEAQEDRRPAMAGGARPREPDDATQAPSRGGGPGRHFGPDSRPKRERERDFKRGRPHRRRQDDDDDDRGRHGSRRFDDDED